MAETDPRALLTSHEVNLMFLRRPSGLIIVMVLSPLLGILHPLAAVWLPQSVVQHLG